MQVKAISACPDTDSATVAGDPAEVFSRLYAEHFTRVCSIVNRRVEDRHLAEELAQETFVELWEHVATGRLDLADVYAPLGFLAMRARRVLSRHLRSTRVLAEKATVDEALVRLADRDEHPIDALTARLSMGQMVLDLPFPLRRALALHLWEDMPVQAVAEQTGQSEDTVTAQVAQGLAALRDRLGVQARTGASDGDRARVLRAMAAPRPVSRAAHLRGLLCAAIAEGRYLPGTVLPARRKLTDEHLGRERDHRLSDPQCDAGRVLTGLCAEGVLTHGPGGTYTVTDAAPVLATRPRRESVTARQHIARELLAGAWPVGSAIPTRRALAARWRHDTHAVNAVFAELIAVGILDAIPAWGGPICVVAWLPATVPAPDAVPALPVRAPRVSRRGARPSVKQDRTLSAIRTDLDAGRWAPGATMPPTRVMAAGLDVCAPLVTRAYKALIAEGRLTQTGHRAGTRYIVTAPTSAQPTPAAPVRIPAPRRSPEDTARVPVRA